MARLTKIGSYAKGQAVAFGRVLRSENRKKDLRAWIAHVKTDATKRFPDKWRRFLKNPRKEARRFWMKKTLGIPTQHSKSIVVKKIAHKDSGTTK